MGKEKEINFQEFKKEALAKLYQGVPLDGKDSISTKKSLEIASGIEAKLYLICNYFFKEINTCVHLQSLKK